MKSYTNKNPQFSDSIMIIEEGVDVNHADTVNVATKQLLDNDLVLSQKLEKFKSQKGSVDGLAELDEDGLVPSSQLPLEGYQIKWHHQDYNLDEANIFTGEAEGVTLPEPGKIFLNYKTGHIYKGVIATKGTRLEKAAEATLIQDKVTHTDETIFSLFLALAQSINTSQSYLNEEAVVAIPAGKTQDVGFQVGTMALFHGNKLIRLEIGYVNGSPTTKSIINKLPEGITITQYGPTQNPSYGFKVINNTSKDITWLNIYMPSAGS